ncbi:MAG: hypothetical protein ACT4NU_06535 [Chromatiales bacterium]
MGTRRTLYVAITFHGFGHIAQTAPVINEVYRRQRGLRVVVQCAAPRALLERHFRVPFDHVAEACDVGMAMESSLDVRIEESHALYMALHERWNEELATMASRLQHFEASLVLVNAPYLPLVAARDAAIPAVALCSLNWADIYYPYCHALPNASEMYAEILDAYRSALAFITPAPSMAMPALANTVAVGPIAQLGWHRRDELCGRLGVPASQRIVTVFMGGVPTELNMDCWPTVDGITYLVGDAGCPRRADMVRLDDLDMPYIDIVCSGDALITKPGYGTFAEAACNGVPVLYVPRDRWPEAPFLVRWLQVNGRCLALTREQLLRGELHAPLATLWQQPRPAPPRPKGIGQAVEFLEPWLPK